MINSQAEHDAVKAMLNSSAWSIFERECKERMGIAFKKAKESKDAHECQRQIDVFKNIEDMVKLPYNLLEISEFNSKGDE